MSLFLFDSFFALHPDLSTKRADIESAFLGLARTLKQGGKIFVDGQGAVRVVARLLQAPRPLRALVLTPEIPDQLQIEIVGARYTDGLWILSGARFHEEALRAAREGYFNIVAFDEAPDESLLPFCDALVASVDERIIESICAALETYFSASGAWQPLRAPRMAQSFFVDEDKNDFVDEAPSVEEDCFVDQDEPFVFVQDEPFVFVDERGHALNSSEWPEDEQPNVDEMWFDDEEPFTCEIEPDEVAEAIAEWEERWKDARRVDSGGPTRAQLEAQKAAFLNRDWAQMSGVDHWSDNHKSILARGDVETVSGAIVSACVAAQWHRDVLGKRVTLGRSGYFVLRVRGQKWSMVLSYCTVYTRDFDARYHADLAQFLSQSIGASFELLSSDTVCFLTYELWEHGKTLESNRLTGDCTDGELVERNVFSSHANPDEESMRNVFFSRLEPDLVITHERDLYERCETLMREWRIYAPNVGAEYFSPFDDARNWQTSASFIARARQQTTYFDSESEPLVTTLPVERLDHIVLVL